MLPLATALLSLTLQGPGSTANVRHERTPVFRQLAESWDDLSPSQRDRALRNYQQYMRLPDEKRHDIDQHYEKWKRLPRSDQDRYRRKHDEYRGRGLVGD